MIFSLNGFFSSDILYFNNMKKNLVLAAAVLMFLAGSNMPARAQDDISSSLKRIGNNVVRTFRSLDIYLDQSTRRIAEKSVDPFGQQAVSGKTFVAPGTATQIDPFTINPILNEVRSSAPYAFNVAFVGTDGMIRAVQPPFPGALGADVGRQEQFRRVRDGKEPVLSKVFLAVEGFPAVAFQHPVLTYDGLFLGAVSILVRPQALLKSVVDAETRGLNVDVWVMQEDGTIIYDNDDEEIGKNLFTDDLYKPFTGLVELGKRIAAEDGGVSQYDFYAAGTDRVIKKNASWITVDVYGTKWKIVATSSMDPAISPERTLCQLGAETIGQAIVSLSKNDSLLQAASKGDEDGVTEILGEFLKKYPCFSVQWVDAEMVNRAGVPAANFVPKYKFDAARSPKEAQFVAAVNARKETEYESVLFEGGTARFHLAPMFKGEEYLGMVYYLWILP